VSPRAPSREEDESDAAAFKLEMADVVPLEPDPRRRVRHAPRITAPPAATPPDIHDDAGDDAFAAPGVDRKEIRKLKRGEYPARDRYDLHGLTAADACVSVERFIDSSRHRRHRCVCIVHGRGLHSAGTPILRARVRKSLRSNPAVLAYADAPRSDGGPGAVYVLLRK
jgi:DNA-nicking Smr family endonuclease